jgi:hypothetical protein
LKKFSDFSGLRDKREELVALRTTTYRDRIILRRILKEIEFDYVNCLRPIHERASGWPMVYKSANSVSVEVVKFLELIPTFQGDSTS